MKKTRFGILGTGWWAEKCHAPGLAAHPEVEIMGMWGRDALKAQEVGERLGIRPEPDLDRLLSNVDAVTIAVPPAIQPDLVCRAAAAGCHLLLEKPLAQNIEAADRAMAAIDKSGVQSVTFFIKLFQQPTAQWLDGLTLSGGWTGATIAILGSLPPGTWVADAPWRKEEFGRLWDGGPHWLAVVSAVLGPIRSVTARRGGGEATQITAIHKDGGLSDILFDFSLPASAGIHSETRFWGAEGIANHPTAIAPSSPPEAMAAAVSALLSASRSGLPHRCDARFAYDIVRILAECEKQLRATA